MLKLLVNGLNGQMGHAVLRILPQFADRIELACGVDPTGGSFDVPVYPNAASIETPFDVAIDFSIPRATMEILSYCVEKKKPIVICTTGLEGEQIEAIEKASKVIPVFRSGNMSLGINLLRTLCRQARQTLGAGFDVEIIETHHNRKIDAPSGTAKMLAESIASASEQEMHCVYGRHASNHRRERNEIGIHSLRGGTIVGEHEVLFLGEDEAVTLKHQAFSKGVFANGALRAAEFLNGKPAGLYDMDDLVGTLI